TQKLLQALLRRFGYSTMTAQDGGAAVELLRERDYSLIVLDLMMPGITGNAVIEFLTATGRDIPVIVCTAARPAATAQLDRAVVKAVVRKPFDIDQFIATINALTGAEVPPLAKVMVIDDDLRARYVLRAFLEPAEITEAESGDDGIELIRRSRPDIVLLDLTLPGTPGEEVLRTLRETVETSEIPVVVVTSRKLDEYDRTKLMKYAAAVIYTGDLSRETLKQALSAVKSR
ncbi:MAG TPA: response regulator, partial [Thermoanaerobaculia bacterium]